MNMKTVIKFSLLSVFAMTSYFVSANAYFNVKSAGDKTFVLSFQKPLSMDAQFRIEDQDGQILFIEALEKGTHAAKKYNMSNLPEGEYFLYLEDEMSLKLQPVVLKPAGLVVEPAKRTEVFKPIVTMNEGKMDFSLLHLSGQPVSIEILNAQGDVLYNEPKAESGSIQRRFDLTNLPAGDYSVAVRTDDNTFYKKVSIR